MRRGQSRIIRGEETVERIGQHRHCKNCDKAIPYKEKYCDENCEKEYKAHASTEKKKLYYFYALMAALFVAAMMLSFA